MINADISKKLSVTDVFCTPDKVNKNPLKKLCVCGFVWTTQQDWLNFSSPSFQVMNNTLTCTNVSDRQGRSWHRFILSHPRKDRDRQRLIDSSVCFAKHLSFRHVGPAFVWNTKRRKKLFIIPDGFISIQNRRNFILGTKTIDNSTTLTNSTNGN